MYQPEEQKEKKEGETTRALNKLHTTIETLYTTFAGLEVKILPILGKDSDETEKLGVPEFSSQLAQTINDATYKLDLLSNSINSVKNRIEL